jgi:hypothetical protein
MNQVNQEQKNYNHVYDEQELAALAMEAMKAEIIIKNNNAEILELKQENKENQGLINELVKRTENGNEQRNKTFNVVIDEEMGVVKYQDTDSMEFNESLEISTEGYQRDLLDGDFPNPNEEEE